MLNNNSGKTNIEQYDIEQLKIISNNFKLELRDAQDGKKTSLAFIIHKFPNFPLIKNEEFFQVVVIGGTVGKIATLKKSGEIIQILDRKEKMLLFKTEEELLDYINKQLPENIDVLALNFAHTLQPVFEDGRLDGVLLSIGKENQIDGLIGKKVGREIEKYIFTKRNKQVKITVANDTVCLLISGLSQFKKAELAAGVVGTGLNFAFFLNESLLVNLESASFDKFPQTKTGKEVDEESSRPGKYFFEKETAGAYLYRHLNLTLRENNINYPYISSTEKLDEISRTEIPEVSIIAQNLLKRSAQLVACQIAGITNFKQKDMTFVMEGSIFWNGYNYRETVEETVRQLVPKHKVNFVAIKDSEIMGAARLIS